VCLGSCRTFYGGLSHSCQSWNRWPHPATFSYGMAGKASLPCNAVVTGYSQLYFNTSLTSYKALKPNPFRFLFITLSFVVILLLLYLLIKLKASCRLLLLSLVNTAQLLLPTSKRLTYRGEPVYLVRRRLNLRLL